MPSHPGGRCTTAFRGVPSTSTWSESSAGGVAAPSHAALSVATAEVVGAVVTVVSDPSSPGEAHPAPMATRPATTAIRPHRAPTSFV